MNNIFMNPVTMRVQDGTLPGDANLCASCRWAVKRQGAQSGFDEIRCGQLSGSPRVPEKLAGCSMFLEKGKLSLHEMSDIAWVIEVKDKHIGFLSPEELARRRESGFRGNETAAPRVGF